MVLIQPSAAELDELQKTPAYEVLQRDQMAHVVYDKKQESQGMLPSKRISL